MVLRYGQGSKRPDIGVSHTPNMLQNHDIDNSMSDAENQGCVTLFPIETRRSGMAGCFGISGPIRVDAPARQIRLKSVDSSRFSRKPINASSQV